MDHPVDVNLGVGDHDEAAAQEVGGEDQDEKRVEDADEGYEVLRSRRGLGSGRVEGFKLRMRCDLTEMGWKGMTGALPIQAG